VLVQQRVEVRAAALPDPRRRIDERDLAEPAPVLLRVAVDVARHEVAVVLVGRVEPDGLAPAELAPQALDQPSLERERERARERPFGRPCVRARERLLRRHVRREGRTGVRLLEPAEPQRAGYEANVERRAGPAQLETREAEAAQLLRAAFDGAAMLDPSGRARPVRLGQAAERQEILRELSLRLQRRHPRIDLAGPVVGRPARDRPAHAHGEARAPERPRLLPGPGVVSLDALLRDAVEEAGLALAADVDLGRGRL